MPKVRPTYLLVLAVLIDFFIKLLTNRKLYLIINTSPRSELNENNGISPASNLYVAGYFFSGYFYRSTKSSYIVNIVLINIITFYNDSTINP